MLSSFVKSLEVFMDWLQVMTIAGATVGSLWWMHKQTFNEMKDFHGRLCTLEERYIQLMQRVLEGQKKDNGNKE